MAFRARNAGIATTGSVQGICIITQCEHQHSLTVCTIFNPAALSPPMRCQVTAYRRPWLRSLENKSMSNRKYEALYGVHLITSLVKRLIRGTFQGRFEPKSLQNDLDAYVFRFNRRKSKSKRFIQNLTDDMRSYLDLLCEYDLPEDLPQIKRVQSSVTEPLKSVVIPRGIEPRFPA